MVFTHVLQGFDGYILDETRIKTRRVSGLQPPTDDPAQGSHSDGSVVGQLPHQGVLLGHAILTMLKISSAALSTGPSAQARSAHCW